MPRRFRSRVFCGVLGVLLYLGTLAAQEPTAPQVVPAAQLQSAIDQLGNLDYDTRSAAARTIRRATPAQVVPVLLQTVAEHADGYVRYRALVLLTGFNDPRSKDAVLEVITSPNDRLRAVAYSFFEHNPDPARIADLLRALETEQGEFVRPSLIRALAAHGNDPRVQQVLIKEAGRGEDYFRSAVIEALGDYHATYAYEAVNTIAKLDGPLQDDSAVALGKMGDKRALETLSGLQRTAPRASQPSVAAAICLLGVNCEAHQNFIIETLKFADQNPGFQDLLRSAAGGLAALAVAGREDAAKVLLDLGIPSQDPTRAPVALGVGMIALRNTPLMMKVLETHQDRSGALTLLAEGFDMLEEDLDKERFFVFARRSYWASDGGSPNRGLMQTLIDKLEF